MRDDVVTLRALRPVMVYGRRVERGARVEMPPVAALDAVEGCHALEFVNPDDRKRCVELRGAEIARMLRRVPAEPVGDPWRPAGFR